MSDDPGVRRRMTCATDETERQIWRSAYGSAFAWHLLANHYDDRKADYYAGNVADRAVMAFRDAQR